jgi:membrane-associated phospholipid phosphatase
MIVIEKRSGSTQQQSVATPGPPPPDARRTVPFILGDPALAPNPASWRDLGSLNFVFLAAAAVLVLSALIAGFAMESFDTPVVLFLNGFVGHSVAFDGAVVGLTKFHMLKGVVLIAGIWLVWFDAPDRQAQARIAAGLAAAAVSGVFSRGLQLVLPTHLRPIHDQVLSLALPQGADPPEVSGYLHSFPSDHAALLFGIAMAIAITRPRVGALAFLWVTIVSLSRVVAGYHFLSDVMGGAALGIAFVCLSQLPAIRRAALVMPRWAAEHAGVFYAGAFIATFSVATMFEEIRTMGKAILHVL